MHALVGDNDQIVVDDDEMASIRRQKIYDDEGILTKIKKVLSLEKHEKANDIEAQHDDLRLEWSETIPIAQHYNPDRNLIYEQIKSSRPLNLTVAVEQVSMFLTGDRTLITFFQVSSSFRRC